MILNKVNEKPDNKLVDLFSAIVAGIAIWFLDFSNIPQFQRYAFKEVIIQSALVKIGSFCVVALTFFIWKSHWRTRWGWILIAAGAVVTSAAIDELLYRRRATDPDFFDAFSPFPMEIVLFLLPALVVMGVMHFLGLILSRRFLGFVKSA